ncbi:MAG: kelch repeat-containing protein, partial [Chloroflexia bacterium]
MAKRLINMLALLIIPVGLVAMLAMFTTTGTSSGASQRTASVASGKGFTTLGTWSDLPVFPNMQLNFGSGACQGSSGAVPLTLKRSSAVAYPPNGKVYLFGGRHRADGDDITSQWIWEYTPGAGSYVQKAAQLDTCAYGTRFAANMASAVLTDSTGVHIYLVGGSSINSLSTNAVRIYDPIADTITASSDVWPAAPMRLPGGYAVYNNKLYIFGGYELKPTSTVYSDTWVFDPMAAAGSKWSQIATATLSVARTSIGGATLDGYIYAIGGNTVSGVVTTTTTPQTIVERMNPSAGSPTWQTVASLPGGRGDMGVYAYDTGSGYEIAGKIMVAGGNFPTPDNNTYIYDPVANTWTAGVSMSRARR